MFQRHYNRHVKSVMKSGKRALAEVVSAEPRASGGISWGEASSRWKMLLKVVPEKGDPFQLDVMMEIPIIMDPVRGTKFQVFYDPDKPESIVVDPASVPKDQKDAVVQTAVDTVGGWGGDTTGMKEAAEGIADPIKAAEAAAAQASRNVDAKREAMMAEVNRVRAEQGDEAAQALIAANTQAMLSQVLGRRAEVGLPPVAPAPPPTTAEDQTAAIKAKLEQLTRLKDAGVLDPERYQASRQRLLDSLWKR